MYDIYQQSVLGVKKCKVNTESERIGLINRGTDPLRRQLLR